MPLGCTLISDFDVQQCVEDSDCEPSSDAPVRICEAQRCVAGCADNSQCQAAREGTAESICPSRGAECVSLRSAPECFDVLSTGVDLKPLRGEDLALIGLFAPNTSGTDSTSPAQLTYQLAINELNDVGGLPGPSAPRPVVGIVCDPERDAVQGGVEHLVQRLGVRAIVAALEPEPLRFAVAGDRPDVLFLNPFLDPGPIVERSDSLWHLFAAQTDFAPAYVPLLSRLQQRLAQARQRPPLQLRTVKIVSSSPDADGDRRLELALNEALGSRAALDRMLVLGLGAERFTLESESDIGAVARAVASALPDLVLLFASGSFPGEVGAALERSAVVAEIERVWPEAAPRPFYVAMPGNLEDDVLTDLGRAADFRDRFVGLNVYRPLDVELAAHFACAYQQEFPERQTRLAAPPNLYDATYLLAYALGAAARPPEGNTPGDVIAGFRRVIEHSGEAVDVGPGGVDDAIRLLNARAPFAVHGVTGPPDFDPETHHRPSSASAYCLVQALDGAAEGGVLWDVQSWGYDEARADFVALPPIELPVTANCPAPPPASSTSPSLCSELFASDVTPE